MSLHMWRRSLVKRAYEAALDSPIFQDSDTNEEYDREFQEFIESISMTTEELAAIVGMAEFSTAEARQSPQYVKINGARQNPSPLGRVVPRVGVGVGAAVVSRTGRR